MLRQRIVLMKIHWDVAVAQVCQWSRHADYLLREEIYGYRACGLRLSWQDFLKRVNRGEATLTVALAEALTVPNLKPLHFVPPLTTKGRKEGGPSPSAKKKGGRAGTKISGAPVSTGG